MAKTPKLICIVDDDASLLRALGRMIESFGFEVALFGSGRACLDGTAIDRAACLILDVSMPNMDGFEFHHLLQKAGRCVPTVFISAHDDKRYERQARSVGSVAFLNKPCDESLLQDAIDKAITAGTTPPHERL
jgi:FixJ family two-component response regulator